MAVPDPYAQENDYDTSTDSLSDGKRHVYNGIISSCGSVNDTKRSGCYNQKDGNSFRLLNVPVV